MLENLVIGAIAGALLAWVVSSRTARRLVVAIVVGTAGQTLANALPVDTFRTGGAFERLGDAGFFDQSLLIGVIFGLVIALIVSSLVRRRDE